MLSSETFPALFFQMKEHFFISARLKKQAISDEKGIDWE